jgi:hypothetical protein
MSAPGENNLTNRYDVRNSSSPSSRVYKSFPVPLLELASCTLHLNAAAPIVVTARHTQAQLTPQYISRLRCVSHVMLNVIRYLGGCSGCLLGN